MPASALQPVRGLLLTKNILNYESSKEHTERLCRNMEKVQ